VRILAPLLFAAVAFAQQGTKPKATPEEYPVHGQEASTAIGAEYMVHSFSRGEVTYLAKDYLVVEVALFPAKDQPIDVHLADFSLRINAKKPALLPDSPAMVAASLTHPEWRTEPHVEMVGGVGNGTVILGRPRPSTIPGNPDPNATGPTVPQVPKDNPSGIESQPRETADRMAVDTALPEGSQKWPVSGFLYFAFTGKPSSIKSLELVHNSTVLRLR
jgi:hypothetical protein